ncbi:hypothetical protein CERSUDRAFT_117318, partial [Gelatoporia subvermispora B]
DFLEKSPVTDPAACQQQIQTVREIADFLRKNVAQAVRLDDAAAEQRWQLRITEETELGDNDTVKTASTESSRSARKRSNLSGTGCCQSDGKSAVPRNFSQLKKAHQQRQIPELREEDIEETFVRGSGPGGQSINKTENNVQLLHKPSGLRVSCQETRSLSQNRKLARRLLLQKLDTLQNPGLSKEDLRNARQVERERQKRKKAKKKAKETNLRDDASSEAGPEV